MNSLNGLSVLRGILDDSLLSAFLRWRETDKDETPRGEFLSKLFEKNAQDNFAEYLSELVIYDDNPFSRAAANSSNAMSSYLVKAYIADLQTIGKYLTQESKKISDEDFCMGKTDDLIGAWNEETEKRLAKFYAQNGYGKFAKYRAFRFAQDCLVPIQTPSTIMLSDLKGYEEEKTEVRENLSAFVNGLPFADMLLYGDRGTGKSSTVHAMANYFVKEKLRLVEIAKEEILSLPRLKSMLASIPMKFIVFIDDFSLSEDDERFSTLKAALQGSMEGQAKNVMIVATSNRRHIVEETFASRSNSVHENDSQQELLSLSDRFGITVLFSTTNKAEYLSIVHALIADAGLSIPRDELNLLAERWALTKGGRSPRRAKQFVDYFYSCKKLKREIKI